MYVEICRYIQRVHLSLFLFLYTHTYIHIYSQLDFYKSQTIQQYNIKFSTVWLPSDWWIHFDITTFTYQGIYLHQHYSQPAVLQDSNLRSLHPLNFARPI